MNDTLGPVEEVLVEVHGSDGSYHTAAQNYVKKNFPGAVIENARYAGKRCQHGNLMVAVTYRIPKRSPRQEVV